MNPKKLLRSSSIAFAAVCVLLQEVRCSNLHNSVAHQSETKPLLYASFKDLPDDLILKLIHEQDPRDLYALMKTSKSLKTRMTALPLLQRLLAEKLELSALWRLPFDPELFQWISCESRNGFFKCSATSLFKVLNEHFQTPKPVVEATILILFDHFKQTFIKEKIHISHDFLVYFCEVVLHNRSLGSFKKSCRWLANCRPPLEKVANIEVLMSKWFSNEFAAFKSVFFGTSCHEDEVRGLRWSTELLLAFLNAEGTSLPHDLTDDESRAFLTQLQALILNPSMNLLISANVVIEKCQDYVNAHKNDQQALYFSFNARFNPDFTFQNPASIAYSSAAALGFINAGRFDEALKVLRHIKQLQEQSLDNHTEFLKRPDFVLSMISKGRTLYPWPSELDIDPVVVDAVLAFYASIYETSQSEFIPCEERFDLYKYILRFGTPSQFGAVVWNFAYFQRREIMHELPRFRRNSIEFSTFVRHWSREFKLSARHCSNDFSSKEYPKVYCTFEFIEAALAHPDAFASLVGIRLRIAQSLLEKAKALPNYQNAPSFINQIVDVFVKI